MIKYIKPLPIPVEMLGAYLEGNLAANDVKYVERMIENDNNFSEFVNELSLSDQLELNCSLEECPSLEEDFVLPEINMELESFIPHMELESPVLDIAACAFAPEIIEEVEIMENQELFSSSELADNQITDHNPFDSDIPNINVNNTSLETNIEDL